MLFENVDVIASGIVGGNPEFGPPPPVMLDVIIHADDQRPLDAKDLCQSCRHRRFSGS